MATTSTHGGACCGMKHIHTFREDDDANVRSLLEEISRNDNHQYAQEVILSNRQATSYPNLIAALARTGFVYTTAFSGRHGTPVHVFHRAKRRLALSAAGRAFNWNGMTANEGISGDLDNWNSNRPLEGAAPANPDADYNIGDMVYITNENNHRYGERHTITGFGTTRTGTRTAQFNYYGDRFELVFASISRNRPNGNAPQGGVGDWVGEYRHPTLAGNAAPVATPPAPLERMRLILDEYFALFADGRVRGPFADTAECRAAYPRARRYRRRIVYSTGRIENNEGILRG